MNRDKNAIIIKLQTLLKNRFHEDFKDLVLFGSQASGLSNNESDFDFLVIMQNKPDWKTEREISDLCYQIDLEYNVLTDVHVLGLSELETLRGKQPIFENAIASGLHV
ncbi:MAG: nucleotidyltransferase domain-containing protein [Flammeovirgaceae bacterium]